jgi:hypothetical protein
VKQTTQHSPETRERALGRLRRLTLGLGGVSALAMAVFAVVAAQTIPGASAATVSTSVSQGTTSATTGTTTSTATAATPVPAATSAPAASSSGTTAAVSGASR